MVVWGNTRIVGRERELAMLDDAVARSIEGHGGLCLLVGEPGIGKTTLVEATADRARAAGATVARGSCWEGGGAPPYWPWIQVLRTLLRSGDPPAAGPAGRVATLLPELADALGVAPAATDTPPDSDEQRFKLFDAVAHLIDEQARLRAVVVVLEDIHAADEASLLLLAFLARHGRDERVLFVATLRDVDADPSEAVARRLDELALLGRRVPLRGLHEPEVAALVARGVAEPSPKLVEHLRRVTGGNPFFVSELVALLDADGRLDDGGAPLTDANLPLPQTVRNAVATRVQKLPRETITALLAAAVVGRTFELVLLADVLETDLATVAERLAPAERARLVVADAGPGPALSFVHALVRETLYRGLRVGRRLELHRAVGESLERRHADQLDDVLPALAHHFHEAVPASVVEKAVEYSRRAGERAARQFAYEEAALHFERALRTASLDVELPGLRGELLLSLGAMRRRAGDAEGACAAAEEAVTIARGTRDGEALAHAALVAAGGLGGPGYQARTDPAVVALLEEALQALDPRPGELRARVLARLSLELYYTDQVDRRRRLADEAVEAAQDAGDPRVRLVVRYARHWCVLGPDGAEERREATAELLALALAADDHEMRFYAHHFRLADAFERGDPKAMDAELEAVSRLAAQLRQPLFTWQSGMLRAARALLQGRADDGERLALAAYEAGALVSADAAANLLAAQLFHHRWLTGRLGELATQIDDYAQMRPWIPTWRCAAAFLRTELGEFDVARAELDALGVHAFVDLPRDANWTLGLSVAALAAARIGDRRHAAALRELLEPVVDRCVILAAGDICMGPVGLAVGAACRCVGDFEAAKQHLDAAEQFALRLGAPPMVVCLAAERVDLLVAQGRLQDAASEARRAMALAGQLRMTSHVERLRPHAEQTAAVVVPSAQRSAPRTAALEKDGPFWRVTHQGRVVLLKDAKGLHYLATLLANPGRELHALDLAGEGRALGVDADAGPALDDAAKRDYRRRIAELDAEVEQARAWRDPEREAGLRAELDALVAELARAVGLGGRDRVEASTAERARVNVTRAVRGVVRRIAEQEPTLGHELEATVHTGLFCRYGPAPDGSGIRWLVAVEA